MDYGEATFCTSKFFKIYNEVGAYFIKRYLYDFLQNNLQNPQFLLKYQLTLTMICL